MLNQYPTGTTNKILAEIIDPAAIVTIPNLHTFTLEIGPDYARRLLTRNRINRKLAPSHVARYLRIMNAGDWDQTHQGIAFNDLGELIDGQHRLEAITQQERAFVFLVTVGWRSKSYRELSVDKGRKRSYCEQYGHKKTASDVVTFITKFMHGQDVLDQRIQEYYQVFGELAEALVEYCGRAVKFFSAAPCKAGAVLRYAETGDEEVFCQYGALAGYKYELMVPRVKSLHKHYCLMQGRFEARDLFLRSWQAFDLRQRNVARIVIRDYDAMTRDIKNQITNLYRAAETMRGTNQF